MAARDRVLLTLRRRPVSGATAVELASPRVGGLDWRRRLSDLRAMGYQIGSKPIKGKTYRRYYLLEAA